MKHRESHKHKAMEAAVSGNQSLSTMLSMQSHREDAHAALLMAYLLVKQYNLPLVLTDHISKLHFAQYPDLVIASHVRCTRTNAAALINKLLAVKNHRKLVDLMQTCKFSIIIDEMTDISVAKQACILAHLFDLVSKEMRSLFYRIVEQFNADAGALFNVIDSNLTTDNILFDNLIGFGSDGAT